MKANNKESFNQIIMILKRLNTKYPAQGVIRHIIDATADYKSTLWLLNDKELLFALNKYELELENNIASDIEVEKIISDAQDLNTILNKEDDSDEMFNIDEHDSWIA